MIRDGKIELPLEGSPSSHILKPQSDHFASLVENEFSCMSLAKAVGLNVASVEMDKAADISYLQVLRFDRNSGDEGNLQRIHQEDFCQALSIPPELKYQSEGGPNLKQCFELVREVSTNPGIDVLALFDAVIFNFLSGNNDAHGKNFSFLYDGNSARLAPIYDLVCTQAYHDLSKSMAMKIGGQNKVEKLTASNWKKLFEDAGLGTKAAARRALALADRVQQVIANDEEEVIVCETVANAIQENRIRLNLLR